MATLGVGLMIVALTGCGRSWSGDDSDRLQDGIDELVSVGGPDGQRPTRVDVVSCDDMSGEVPYGVAQFDHAGPPAGGADALNAEGEKLAEWYLPRWKKLGWEIDPAMGSATKQFDGRRLRASVDGATETNYSVIVAREGAGLCS
jgi:hypothetical protein